MSKRIFRYTLILFIKRVERATLILDNLKKKNCVQKLAGKIFASVPVKMSNFIKV